MDGEFIMPIAPPPPGIDSNFDNPDDLSWRLAVTIGVTLPIAGIVCLLRLYTSRFIVGRWHVDDVLVGCALLLSIGYAISNTLQAKYALGRHLWDVPYEDGVTGAMIEITAGAVTYNLSLMMTKLSILCFYLRFPASRSFKVVCYAIMAMVIGNALTAGFSFLYLCRPIRKHWDWAVEGNCVASFTIPFWVAAIVNMVTDVFILLLPVWLLKPLRLPLPSSSVVCGITIYRVVDIPKSLTTMDVTWDYVDNYMWMYVILKSNSITATCKKPLTNLQLYRIIEINVAIICACLPCLKAFLSHHFPNAFFFSERTQGTVNQALSFLNTTPPAAAPVQELASPWQRTRDSLPSDIETADHRSDRTGKWTGSTRPETGDHVTEVPRSSSSFTHENKEAKNDSSTTAPAHISS
ncbi:unnamed protein product [Parascedosporium putredinis]|uniref:Rhodopsin domain-containing protein n=1 Tax=Parascedosporium putredinis TaxID=1442378 RepID=A0A9P1M9T9_9PEZI|nr:unnamed protein product [Parascedosporium putredinis]CAI7992674.1 unnamed protein product [Parascedosporium putredinis]